MTFDNEEFMTVDGKNIKLPKGIKMPSSVSSGGEISSTVQAETIKTRRAEIDAGARVESAKLAVAQEAIKMVSTFLETAQSFNKYKSTVAEWQGRITQGELAVEKARIELAISTDQGDVKREELALDRAVVSKLLELFDEIFSEIKSGDSGLAEKAETRKFLLELSDRMVLLRKK